MPDLVLHHSKLATIGGFVLAVVMLAICIGVLTNVDDAGIVPVLMSIGSGIFAVVNVRKLLTSEPALVVDAEGVVTVGIRIPWSSITALQVTRGGIPIRLKVHLQVPDGSWRTIDLQELNRLPNEALRQFLLCVERHRPDLGAQNS